MRNAKALLIQNGELYAPKPLGVKSLLCIEEKIVSIGDNLSPKYLEALELDYEVIDASGCVVTPGYIDPHEHLAGGSGEEGFASQTPNINLCEIIEAGITTVIGCLGVDTLTQNLTHLLGKVKAFNEEGITAFMYSGGYDVPPASITGNVRSDIMLISEVIGAGEICISDKRSSKPNPEELAHIVHSTYTGGKLTGKAGVCHFHVGEGTERLDVLHTLLKDYDIIPESLYPTHVERSPTLIKDAAHLTKNGVTVDMDTMEEDTLESIRTFLEYGGLLSHLTLSSDAAINSPMTLCNEFRRCVLDSSLPLETLLPLITSNTARVLKLKGKGLLETGADADINLHSKKDFELKRVIARGKTVYRDGQHIKYASYLQEFKRRYNQVGFKAPPTVVPRVEGK